MSDAIINSMALFLRSLASDLESSKLSTEDLKKIFEFYIQFKFEKDLLSEKDDKDFIKFLTLGWYIYTNLLSRRQFHQLHKTFLFVYSWLLVL